MPIQLPEGKVEVKRERPPPSDKQPASAAELVTARVESAKAELEETHLV